MSIGSLRTFQALHLCCFIMLRMVRQSASLKC